PRDLECPLRDHRAAHLPRQRHGVPTGRHHDLLPREQAAQVALQPGCVRRDLDREEVQAPRAVQTNRLVVPSSRALTTISRSETSCTSTTFGSPTEMRAIAPGCWYRADLPLATEITRSASVST